MGCAGPNHLADSASFEKDSALSCLVVCSKPSSINLPRNTIKKQQPFTIGNKQTKKNEMLLEDYICVSLSFVTSQEMNSYCVEISPCYFIKGVLHRVLLVPGCSDLSLAA